MKSYLLEHSKIKYQMIEKEKTLLKLQKKIKNLSENMSHSFKKIRNQIPTKITKQLNNSIEKKENFNKILPKNENTQFKQLVIHKEESQSLEKNSRTYFLDLDKINKSEIKVSKKNRRSCKSDRGLSISKSFLTI